MLNKKFVVVPIDKASVNITFVFQRPYAQFLLNKPGLNNIDDLASTYRKPIDRVVSENRSFLKNKFKLEVNDVNQNFLIHTELLNCKKSHKARFIIVAPN